MGNCSLDSPISVESRWTDEAELLRILFGNNAIGFGQQRKRDGET